MWCGLSDPREKRLGEFAVVMEDSTIAVANGSSLREIFGGNNVVAPTEVLQHLVDTKVLTEAMVKQAVSDLRDKKLRNQVAVPDANGVSTANEANATSKKSKHQNKKQQAAASAAAAQPPRRTRHIALKFCYDGSHYSGLAQNVGQDSDNSVEKALFAALTKSQLVESRDDTCRYSRCGRTDRGVSAAGQVVALHLKSAIPLDATWQAKDDESTRVATRDLPANEYDSIPVWVYPRSRKQKQQKQQQQQSSDTSQQRVPKTLKEYPYTRILNNLLPPSIRILGWTPVTDDFSARFSATTRLYRYFFVPRQAMSLDKIQQALSLLEGTHDFRNFCKMDVEKVYNFERKILSARVVKQQEQQAYCSDDTARDSHQDTRHPHDVYYLEILGQAFLWHQIRCIAQVVFMVGRGLEEPSVVTRLLDVARCPGKPAYPLADEKPLVLHDCRYHDLPLGYSVQNLWTVSCQLEQQWEEHTLAAARLRNCIDSLRSCNVRKDDLKDFCTAKLTERNRKRKRARPEEETEEKKDSICRMINELVGDAGNSLISWSDSLAILQRLHLVPDPTALDSSLHVPLMERSRGTTYEEKIESLKNSDRRRQKYDENVIKKRKSTEEDAAFYDHMTKQGVARES